jgi:hypothetical protein
MTIFEPEKPCRRSPTRGCPILREAGCPDDPCARYESDDEAPWAADVEQWRREADEARNRLPAVAFEPTIHDFVFLSAHDEARSAEWCSSPSVLERICLSLGPHEYLRLGPGASQLGIITGEVRPCSPE